MASVKEIIAGISRSPAGGGEVSSTEAATLSVIIDDGATEHRERLPALPDVAQAMSAYDRLWKAAIERGYTLRGGSLEIDGRVYRVSKNGRLWDGTHAVTEAQAQSGGAPKAHSGKKPIHEHGR